MQFEENDMRIKEAADHHHPAYDEQAWDKMQKLLDKHLPVQKKDRRRIVLWLFLFMLTICGGVYLLVNNKEPKKETAAILNQKAQSASKSENETKEKNKNNVSGIADEKKTPDTGDKIIVPSTPTENKTEENINAVKSFPSSNRNKPEPIILLSPKPAVKNKALRYANGYSNPFVKNQTDISAKNKNNVPDHQVKNKLAPILNPDSSIKNTPTVSLAAKKDAEVKNISPEKTPDNNNTSKKAETISIVLTKNDVTVATEKSLEKISKSEKTKNKKLSAFFFSFSAGPESVKVPSNQKGKIKPAYGIGIGYTFKNRLSVQTGFYAVRKIYTAAGKDYKAPDWWLQYYPNMQKVEADCKVYEIPLTVSYNFIENKKGNIFVLLGLSSYLMKKEDYTYHYKTNTGQYRVSSYTYNNENKHFLSVLNIGAGYERKLNSTISLAVSPYLKMPLSGVGFGKVKLISSGILVSAVVRPFVRK